jgi:hypothetical protein
MSETELQIAKQQMSEQKLRVLEQQAVVLSLKREGGKQLEEAGVGGATPPLLHRRSDTP